MKDNYFMFIKIVCSESNHTGNDVCIQGVLPPDINAPYSVICL